jgi:hypothetical protein
MIHVTSLNMRDKLRGNRYMEGTFEAPASALVSSDAHGVDWRVTRTDAFGRQRVVGVKRKPTGVALMVPPDEVARLDHHQLRELLVGLAQEHGQLRPPNELLPVGA